MKFLIMGVLGSILLCAMINGAEKDCKTVPTVHVTECCKIPETVDRNIFEEVAKNCSKDSNELLADCKLKQAIFKKLDLVKNDDVNLEAAQTYLKNFIKDADWKKVMSDSLTLCNKEMSDNVERYQKLSNFTKEECNVKYSAVVDCIQIAAFADCPKSSWTEKANCSDAKKFVLDCHKDFDAMEKFSENQHKSP